MYAPLPSIDLAVKWLMYFHFAFSSLSLDSATQPKNSDDYQPSSRVSECFPHRMLNWLTPDPDTLFMRVLVTFRIWKVAPGAALAWQTRLLTCPSFPFYLLHSKWPSKSQLSSYLYGAFHLTVLQWFLSYFFTRSKNLKNDGFIMLEYRRITHQM